MLVVLPDVDNVVVVGNNYNGNGKYMDKDKPHMVRDILGMVRNNNRQVCQN